ncbi:winged helix-turn-helix transcriptional regulator [Halorarum halophilum]|uniref:Winged helix-turn-helix transcriptional regulator n=1 Tax=Halorarum halophilum TaxID=2743090 RepID=A0A7D5GD79_9EURY|nr:winged helix-turn-helix transcriptional regulator [Halobaculum halophilum]QLG28812.1 winged helix-turn-helix transcriptional regulator [Halobaculum halophilum]
MSTDALDELDFGILHLLQEDARNISPVDMEDELPVSDTTIRNRIEKLEERGIIEGYVPLINYEKAGFPLRVKFACTAPVQERSDLAEEALELHNVVDVEEMLSAHENVQILVVTDHADGLHEVTSQIDALGLTIERESLVRRIHRRPFNHFGEHMVSGEK